MIRRVRTYSYHFTLIQLVKWKEIISSSELPLAETLMIPRGTLAYVDKMIHQSLYINHNT